MNEICGDNRFEIIAKAKADLIESTNIETNEAEMAVIDNILFRCWQMGWLDRYERKTENSSENPNNSTSSKMEQVDKDINVRSKDEPQTEDFQDWKDRMWAEAIVTEQKWTCARCGCENHADFKWCFKCGFHKPERSE